MIRRAKKPINQGAVDCANEKFYANHPGDPQLFDSDGNWIPLHPTASKHTNYRIEWMDLYEECGGEIESDDGGKTDPLDPCTPCKEKDVLILVEVKELVVLGPRSELRAVVEREQYVNLDDQVDTTDFHPEYGRFVRLVARVEWQSGKKADLAGHTVVWTESHLDDERIVDLEKSQTHGFDSPGSTTSESRSVTQVNGWTAPIEFYLSTYGGDRFSLSASLEGESQKLSGGAYQVWRKFWYQVTEMKRKSGGLYELPSGAATKFEDWFREAFIRFEEEKTGSKRTIAKYKADIPHESKDALGSIYYEPSQFTPFKVHFMMVASLLHNTSQSIVEATIDQPVWQSPDNHLVYRQEEEDKPWLLYAAFRRKGRDRWRTLSPKRVRAVRQGAEDSALRYKIEVDFSRGAVKVSPDRPIEIRLRVGIYGSIGMGGMSQHAMIGVAQIGTTSLEFAVESLGKVVAHEAGHCLGLLNFPPAGDHDHDAWLDPMNRHCNVPGCMMSYKALKGSTRSFHYDGVAGIGCMDYLRRQDFSRANMAFWKS